MKKEYLMEGGVTAPKGFRANGALCHIKESRTTPDVALIVSDKMCNAAGLFTQNRVKAQCVKWDIERIKSGHARAIIANSGNANACTGEAGAQDARCMAKCAAEAINTVCAGEHIQKEDVLVCSTGVIGQRLPIEKIEAGVQDIAKGLDDSTGHQRAASAIMTTDTERKECAISFTLGDNVVRIGAMCKGSGMIHLNLGTMLCFITTDAAITAAMLDKAVRYAAKRTFNCVSIDGDTSTNDTLLILANGEAGNCEIAAEGEDYDTFTKMLTTLCTVLARKIAADGEGATRLVECNVSGAKDEDTARGLAKAVISSNLVKAAMFGRDANCGRVLCALGYSGYDFDPDKASVVFAGKCHDESGDTELLPAEYVSVEVIHDGAGLAFDEERAKRALSCKEVEINIRLQDGEAKGTAWGCDLTYDYVKINGDYRT